MTEPAIAATAITVRRGRQRILRDVTISVPAGSIHALVGHNGAGKTTFLKVLAGVIAPESGTFRAPSSSVLFSPTVLPPEVCVQSLLDYQQRSVGGDQERTAHIASRTGITSFTHVRCGSLSQGMRQRVALTLALMKGAKTLILDEPTTGLDPDGVASLISLIVDLKADGRTVLICSHDLSHLELVCDGISCMRSGRVTLSGQLADVVAGLPPSPIVIRTSNDAVALQFLSASGLPAYLAPAGVVVAAGASYDLVVNLLTQRVRIDDISSRDSAFFRIFTRYASDTRATRRGR